MRAAPSRPIPRIVRHVVVFLCFLILGLLHYRAIWWFREGIVLGDPFDGAQNAFHLWWMRYAFLHGVWPYVTPFLAHPVGAEMYWHTLAPIKAAWGIVLLPFFDPVSAENLLLFLTFVVSGYTTWLFLRYLVSRSFGEGWVSTGAAFAGACVFLLSPYFLVNVVGHINLLSVEGIPVFLLFSWKYKESGALRHWVFAALAALYVALCDYYYLLFILMIPCLDAAFAAWKGRALFSVRSWWNNESRRSLACSAAALLGISPVLGLLLWHAFPAPANVHAFSNYPVDPVSYFLPGARSFWIRYFPEAVQAYMRKGVDSPFGATDYFLGWVTLLIASYAVFKNIGSARRFAAIGLVFLLLSLGPFLTVAGRSFHTVPLPYLLFQLLVPFVGRGGVAVRFMVITYLALAVCFALAAAALAKKRPLHLSGVEVLFLCFLIPNIEYLSGSVNIMQTPRLPEEIVERIRSEPAETAILADRSPLSVLEVTRHEHPVSVAFLSRIPVDVARERQHKLYLLEDFPESAIPFTEADIETMKATVRRSHFKYFISHKLIPSRDAFVRSRLGGVPLFSNPEFQVYRLYE